MTDVSVGLVVVCGCLGSSHKSTCTLVTKLPLRTTAHPGKYFIEIGTFNNVHNVDDVYKIQFPVCFQFNVIAQSPLYNKVDGYEESLAYINIIPSNHGQKFIQNFLQKIIEVFKRNFNYHKNYKMFVADNVERTKQALHFEPFPVKIGGFCLVETSDNFTVDFMNKRRYLWTHGLSTVDGAELNNRTWNKTSRYYIAKRKMRAVLWVFVLVVILMPLVVHNIKDHDALCLERCCNEETDCALVNKYFPQYVESVIPDVTTMFSNFTAEFNLSSFKDVVAGPPPPRPTRLD